MEINKTRFKKLVENLNRNKIKTINLYNCDYFEIKNKYYNKILVDVPCSGSGVMSKHSDARWKYSDIKIKEHTKKQLDMLNHSATLLEEKYSNKGILYIIIESRYKRSINHQNSHKINPLQKMDQKKKPSPPL